MNPAGYAECMVCDTPAVRSCQHGAGRVVLCGYHADLLGKYQSFGGSLRKRYAEKKRKGRAK